MIALLAAVAFSAYVAGTATGWLLGVMRTARTRRHADTVERISIRRHPSGAVVIERQAVPVPTLVFNKLDAQYMSEAAEKEEGR